ncbi:MAG: methylglyoxal synthase [Clostridia bacterium]|nr:methylglyoxal synthase [Clostridia bacterium]
MEIAIMAEDTKKELMAQFCSAYCGILSKHHICSTGALARYISENTGLSVEGLLSGMQGGREQISQRVAYNEIDLLIMFRDSAPESAEKQDINECLRLCDYHNIPYATNIGTAEALIIALDRGDLDWRMIVKSRG